MANHLVLNLSRCLMLLSYVAAILASPALSGHYVRSEPQLLDFPNERLYHAYLVIQRFKSTITSDPKNITSTWSGNEICGKTAYLGFFCDTPGQAKILTVTAVILNGYELHAPTLKGFIDQLPDLAFFHAASNNFGTDVPLLAGLTYMYKLSVVANDIQPQVYGSAETHGTATAGCVKATVDFHFYFDTDPKKKKKGCCTVPGATDSKALLLNYNNLSGQLPSNLGFSKFSYLALANNKLTGPIPSSISNLQDSLLEVLLLNNQLSGCLPHELGMLTKAAVIDAGMNQLTGPIPSSFSCLTSVEQLNLGGNRLYGEIPDALCKLAAGPAGRLANLTLSSNYFTSVGPACLSLIKDGILNVKNNCIPGFANQRRPAECASFLSHPKTCPAATATHLACPAAAANAAAAPADRVAKDYSSYVTYATLHE
uniref:Leucine-rich repeat-containing N-terminal plant-type domain-containing protein n=1 Tax=Oryza glumipatula TaxID=40148 RepID=A0A0D9YUY6_9ORYZ